MNRPLLHRLLALHKKLNDMTSDICPPCSSAAYDLAGSVYEAFRCHNLVTAASEELLLLLSRPCLRALLDAHDRIASKEYFPVLPEISEQVDEDELAVKIVHIEKRKEPLGATLRVAESGLAYVARVLNGGPADRSGVIHCGDEVHEVNGQCVHGMTVEEVAQLMSLSDRSVVLKLVPTHMDRKLSRDLFTVRANFTYDPATDPTVPCRDAGLAIKKGDILHVVNARNSSWWEAYKDGSDTQHCSSWSRLIPSFALLERQHGKTEGCSTSLASVGIGCSPSHHIANSSKRTVMPLLAGGLLSPRLYRKTRKTKRATYETMLAEELCTDIYPSPYEEVKLLPPIPGKRRPLILVGPDDVVRHELRQKLLSDKLFCAPVLHTTRPKKLFESEGKDYYFISRPDMEAEIEEKRFVEFGEYKGNLYGTKIDTIVSIIASGRTCVMAPSPQAIELLRRRDIKPYVVYVEPTIHDNVKLSKISSSDDRGKQDTNEETDVAIRAAKMDAVYGHRFDCRLAVSSVSAAYKELLTIVKKLEAEPQWLPANWVEE